MNGANPSIITVQGTATAQNPYRIFKVNPSITAEIDGLTIAGGFENTVSGGGGIKNFGNLTLYNNLIDDNTASNGGWGGGISNSVGAGQGNAVCNEVNVADTDDAGGKPVKGP